ncbi:MAG: thioredoxin fold domain-containing protein [Nitrospirae bacterium]|jgi:thiol:disulfide interchange protein DsbC|nr:thioredoxin fold domain-containing protein [Nitrospirota bacterium]
MKKVVKDRKDIAFYIKLAPLVNIHPQAYEKSKAIVCENSLKLLEDAYEKKPLPAAKCLAPSIDKNIELVKKIGITGAPAMVLPDGRIIRGFKDASAINELIGNK